MPDSDDDLNTPIATRENAETVRRLITFLELKGVLSDVEAAFILQSDEDTAEAVADSLTEEEKERYNELIEDRL